MSSDASLEIRNLTKSFVIKVRSDKNQSKKLTSSTKSIEKVVLDDISITVKKGEVLGIIGRNGSGKSTLLYLISRILQPDSGEVICHGKVASILELGPRWK